MKWFSPLKLARQAVLRMVMTYFTVINNKQIQRQLLSTSLPNSCPLDITVFCKNKKLLPLFTNIMYNRTMLVCKYSHWFGEANEKGPLTSFVTLIDVIIWAQSSLSPSSTITQSLRKSLSVLAKWCITLVDELALFGTITLTYLAGERPKGRWHIPVSGWQERLDSKGRWHSPASG